ncbi:hypothetical protein D3C80_2091970 [compost metagenome]
MYTLESFYFELNIEVCPILMLHHLISVHIQTVRCESGQSQSRICTRGIVNEEYLTFDLELWLI